MIMFAKLSNLTCIDLIIGEIQLFFFIYILVISYVYFVFLKFKNFTQNIIL